MSKPLKPLGIGDILDRTFQIYRRHFTQLMVIMIILIGPYILLENVLVPGGETELLPSYDIEFDSMDDLFEQIFGSEPVTEYADPVQLGMVGLYLFLVLPLTLLVFSPWAVSSVTLTVESALTGKQRSLSELLKRPLKRLGALIGNSLLYYILLFAILIGIVLLFTILIMVVYGSETGNVALAILGGLFLFVLFLAMMFLVLFFAIRWMFYIPFIVVDGKGLSIGSSWSLTKKHFWRIFGILLLMFTKKRGGGGGVVGWGGGFFFILGFLWDYKKKKQRKSV
jgi:hypothetical protein